MLPVGKIARINACRARESTRKFLEGLGIVPGVPISIVSEMNGSLIVNIKGSRVAINRGIAQQLMVEV